MRALSPLPILCLVLSACAQPEKVWEPAVPTSELDGPDGCFDGVDNDSDDLIDCMDPDCATECDADNWPPEVQSVHIEPADPDTRDALTCVAEANDLDGDVVSWEYHWFRDGVFEAEGQVLPSERTVGYDHWTCEATPSDDLESGLMADASTTIEADDACTSVGFATDGRVLAPRRPGQDLTDTDFTVEAWVRPDPSGGTTLPIVDSDPQADLSGWRLALVGDPGSRMLRFQVGGGIPDVPALEGLRTVADGTWSHVAVTYDRATGEVTGWVDGIPAGTATVGPLASGASVDDLALGGTPSAGYQFLGHLDEVRISTVIRYTTDFSPRTWFEPDADTLGLWHLDEGVGTTTADAVSGESAQLDGVDWDTVRSACETLPEP